MIQRFLCPVRGISGHHAIHDCAGGVHIPAGTGTAAHTGLFGRHIKQRPQGGRLIIRHSALTEVSQTRLMVLAQQDVRRLQIAVQNAFTVAMIKPHTNFPEQHDGLVRCQRPTAFEFVF